MPEEVELFGGRERRRKNDRRNQAGQIDKLPDADKDHEDRRPGDRTRNPVKPGDLLDPDRRGRVRRIGIRIARGYLRHTNAPLSRWPRMRSTSAPQRGVRSEEHTSELQSLMRISYAVFCLNKNKHTP